MKIYNSLSKAVEEFVPINKHQVTMYLCGPTVYDYVTIGNFRTYTLGDFIARILKFNGYNLKFVMNLTDVGHLTGDNDGDADLGKDRLEDAAAKENKSARDIANYYIEDFYRNYDKLNLTKPAKFSRATDYIKEQIDLVQELETRGYTYNISDGVYFDTSKFPAYGELSGMTAKNVKPNSKGARVEYNPEKKNPNDFALWKLSPLFEKRWQEWDSPWGKGFPGWHLECSAMILSELGETIDLHVGGEDLKMIHHQNEIAQSEAATDKKFVNYWVHGAFLQVDGGRMGKSLGNAYTVPDLEDRQCDPIALRYFYTTAHYRSTLNFTWDSIQAATLALKKLYDIVSGYQDDYGSVNDDFISQFSEVINDDLNLPKAVSVTWDLLKSNVSEPDKIVTLLKFDEVLGLNIGEYIGFEIPQKIQDLAKTRQGYRENNIWDKADIIRKEIENLGYTVLDKPTGFKLKRKI